MEIKWLKWQARRNKNGCCVKVNWESDLWYVCACLVKIWCKLNKIEKWS